MLIVCDTSVLSVLSALAGIGLLELLPVVAGSVTIPEAVDRDSNTADHRRESRRLIGPTVVRRTGEFRRTQQGGQGLRANLDNYRAVGTGGLHDGSGLLL